MHTNVRKDPPPPSGFGLPHRSELESLVLPPRSEHRTTADRPGAAKTKPDSLQALLEPSAGLKLRPAGLQNVAMDQLSSSLKELPPDIYKVEIRESGKKDGTVHSLTVRKCDDDTFIIRHDWEQNGRHNKIFVFKREGTEWQMSSAYDVNGKAVPRSEAEVDALAKDLRASNQATQSLKYVSDNIDSLRRGSVIDGAKRFGWFNPAEPPVFSAANALGNKTETLTWFPPPFDYKLQDGSGAVMNIERVAGATFAAHYISGNPPVKESLVCTESGGRWYATAFREKNGVVTPLPLDDSAQKSWAKRFDALFASTLAPDAK